MIVFFTGSYPPSKCGVGDYLYNLVANISPHHPNVKVIKNSLFEFIFYAISNRKTIRHVNIQYPTIGYASNYLSAFKPHFVTLIARFLGIRVSITLHEFTSLSSKARFFANVFKIANNIVATSEYEYENLVKFGFNKDKVIVIPIGSNIKESDVKDKTIDFINFGILSPGKGIEDFLYVIEKIRLDHETLKVVLAGYIPDNSEYVDKIIAQAKQLNIEFRPNQTEDELSILVGESKRAILPYNDGISERRGTALAAMINKCVVYSYTGNSSEAFNTICMLARDRDELYNKLIDALHTDSADDCFIAKAYEYALARHWDKVSEKYLRMFYENCSK